MTPKQREINRIIERLSQAIAQHKLPPGMRLVEAQLVEALDANRNHVQAALQRLSMLHIVTIEANRGASVAKPTAQEARDVFAARRAVERGIVEAITQDKLERNRDRIDAHMAREKQATDGEDRRDIVRSLSDFHLLLAEISENTVLREILQNLMTRSSLIVSLYQRNDQPPCQHDEHGQIIAALAEGDRSRAHELMIEHLNHLESELDLSGYQATPDSLQALLTTAE
ncbi:GntR family transcriptional regulator [Marinobacterium sp. YM272]|uniref:GntR family transcriptional regulator n=1 Tax=Marinobacterium sp. YM272 TaxID=3421654 RepID=UPI003D7F4A80